MRKSLITAALMALMAATPAMAEPSPRVLVSIKPLHGLVASVMKGVAEPGLIVAGVNSPHGYAMKPSDLRALEQADLVVWVGKDFETWLAKPLAKVRNRISMRDLPGMLVLDSREGGVWEAHGHAKPKHHHHDDHDETDSHVWLDPDNAARLVDAVAIRLKSLDPAHAALYDANAAETRSRLTRLDSELAARLIPVASKPYVVFHDAQQYFEKRYGLSPAGAMTVDPERPLSAKRLASLRDRLKTANAACVFREPGYGAEAAKTLADAAGVRIGELDPEGTRIEPGPDAYVALMTGLGNAIADCLSGR
ncbi:zinc ABC transporter substrate-binding protein [Paramagnetospirillum marisnigri]|uniref:High-affinity zinc uptake system protein ZnuA n=1 Tax=Paramagnetospirillum marisnigri TaxID=1285242 RepID=A0A178M9N1_9PROT|nr:zinc ABC transporter substrate-binding protein [Paramagnetospirillum marisnigri]OAN44745.1 zinc ABC transporter substrate-binding protein [Paramagnetospirillum marisnigri]